MWESIGIAAGVVSAIVAVLTYVSHFRKDSEIGTNDDKNTIESSQQGGRTTTSESPGCSRRDVPEGVDFYPLVIQVPKIPSYFDRPLWIAGRCTRGQWLCEPGDWVVGGTHIYRFKVLPAPTPIAFLKSSWVVHIDSPATGLVVHTSADLFDDGYESENIPSCAIIPCRPYNLPKLASTAYDRFAIDIRDSAETLFTKWTEQQLDREEIGKELAEICNKPLVKAPVSEYRDAIDALWEKNVPATVIERLRLLASNNPSD